MEEKKKRELSFRFKDVESDIGKVIEAFGDEVTQKKGIFDFEATLEAGFQLLADAYFVANKEMQLIDWTANQMDSGGGDKFLAPLSERLVCSGNTSGLLRLWRPVIASRQNQELRDAAVAAMTDLWQALEKVGDSNTAAIIRNELQSYLEEENEVLAKPTRILLTENVFWDLVQQAKESSGALSERPRNLVKLLTQLSGKAIKDFSRLLTQEIDELNNHSLWAVAYIVRDGCGDDEFMYFRAWVVSEGRAVFQNALSDPESIAAHVLPGVDPQLEALMNAPSLAYRRRTGKSLPRAKAVRNTRGTAWHEEELPLLFPTTWGRVNS